MFLIKRSLKTLILYTNMNLETKHNDNISNTETFPVVNHLKLCLNNICLTEFITLNITFAAGINGSYVLQQYFLQWKDNIIASNTHG